MGGRRAALGQRGERAAARWYEARGYQVVARNWRCSAGEIDIVCATTDPTGRSTLVVCEVKTRSTDRRGHPFEAVTPAKQRRLRRLAAAYLRSQCCRFDVVRFDVVAVSGRRLDVVEDAF